MPVFGPGGKIAKRKVVPIIVVPTTAGMIRGRLRSRHYDEATHTKRILLYPYMMPATVILIPH